MKEYIKPLIEEETIELEDIIAVSVPTVSIDKADEIDPSDLKF